MRRIHLTFALVATILLSACASLPDGRLTPPAASTEVRNQLGRLAVRTSSQPRVDLTADLDTKGKAAGKTALAAGSVWLGGTAQAAAETGEPISAALMLGFGLITTPIVAAGGAIYGASAADTKDAIEEGNAVIQRALDFTPERLAHALDAEFQEGVPVSYELVGNISNSELQRRGFDTVLDVVMRSITSTPNESRMHATFNLFNDASLTRLTDNHRLVTREFYDQIEGKAVSSWAANDCETLLGKLDGEYAELASQLSDDLFFRPSVRVQGIAPVSTGPFRTTKLKSAQPKFRWSAMDGDQTARGGDIYYEISYSTKKNHVGETHHIGVPYFQPPETLQTCKKYYWKVRAHYSVFGETRASEWSPVNRFKTSCEK